MSWISEEEKLLQIQNDCEREHMDEIRCTFIYTNPSGYIDKITNEMISLVLDEENDMMIIPKSKVLKIIQEQKRAVQNSRYIYKSAFSHIVSLEPDEVWEYVHGSHEEDYNFFKELPLLENIEVPASIFIFNEINSIYFLFQESDKPAPAPKPILKIHNVDEPFVKSESSKKVTIKLKKKKGAITRKNV